MPRSSPAAGRRPPPEPHRAASSGEAGPVRYGTRLGEGADSVPSLFFRGAGGCRPSRGGESFEGLEGLSFAQSGGGRKRPVGHRGTNKRVIGVGQKTHG